MKKISLSTVLYAILAPFVVRYVNTYISGGKVLFDNSVFYLMTFIGLIFLIIFDIKKSKNKSYHYTKLIIISITILTILLTATLPRIQLRQETYPEYNLNDSGAKTLNASNLLIRGKNPYAVNFSSTPFGHIYSNKYSKRYEGEFMHYVYLPFFLLSNTFVQIITYHYFGFADSLIILIIFYFLSLILLYLIPKNKEKKLSIILIAALNPYFLISLIHGQNDIFTFFLILISLFFLNKNKDFWSIIFLGLACASKQYAWFLTLFYFFHFYYIPKNKKNWPRIKYSFKKLLPGLIVFIIFISPFLFWSASNFIKDVFLFGIGGLKTSFPASGVGWGGILVKSGIIKSMHGFSITYILQILISLPLFLWLIKKLKCNNTVKNITLFYTLFTFTFFVFSRFFNDSFIGLFSLLLVLAWTFGENKVTTKKYITKF
ncbi:MAG: glycosyltransferase family 87 protein [Patescibacteria group bacterium]|nr:glycosyltransferase family 87 protein [Patescibacteria group bacterium]